jgi:hypothetical protein
MTDDKLPIIKPLPFWRSTVLFSLKREADMTSAPVLEVNNNA